MKHGEMVTHYMEGERARTVTDSSLSDFSQPGRVRSQKHVSKFLNPVFLFFHRCSRVSTTVDEIHCNRTGGVHSIHLTRVFFHVCYTARCGSRA